MTDAQKKRTEGRLQWRAVTENRKCQGLDDDGKRCHYKATWVGPYHGSSEMYGLVSEDAPDWVQVELCTHHASGCP